MAIVDLILPTIVAATPVIWATLAAVLTYRAGLLDIGLEGKMAVATAASIAWLALVTDPVAVAANPAMIASQLPIPPWVIGIGAAILAAVVMSLIHGLVTLVGKADPFISGIGINLTGLAVVPLILVGAFHSPSSSPTWAKITVPSSVTLIPGLNLFQSGAFIAALLVAIWFGRSRMGAHIHARGMAPEMAASCGINLTRVGWVAFIGSGIFAGLAGAALTVGAIGTVTPTMVGGRGFLALAAAVVGRGRVWASILACLVFGIGEALADYLVTAIQAPELLLALPWALALVGVLVSARLAMRRPDAEVTGPLD